MATKKRPTESANVIEAESISQSAIQQGSPQATQTVSFAVKSKADLEGIISKLSASLESLGLDQKEVTAIKADTKTIQDELAKEPPKEPVIRACLNSIKSVLEKATVAVAASGAGQLVASLLAAITRVLRGE